jgi:hypothetical protein
VHNVGKQAFFTQPFGKNNFLSINMQKEKGKNEEESDL